MARTYTTRDEAIHAEIVEVIEAGDAKAEEFDVEAIADAVLGDHSEGYAVTVSEGEFWRIVAENAR
jgi:hypothetical protein